MALPDRRHAEVDRARHHLDDVVASLGDLTARGAGLVALRDDLIGSWLQVDVAGLRLADIEPFVGVTGLPKVPFSLAGTVHAEPEGYRLDDTVATIGVDRLTVDGLLTKSPDLVGSSLELSVGGPDLERTGRLAAELVELPDLPPEPYTATASIAVDATGCDVPDLVVTVGHAEAKVSGRIGLPPAFVNTDVTVRSRGPNAALFSSVTGKPLPEAPFSVDGRVARTTGGFRFDDQRAQLGDSTIELHGALGQSPRFVGSDLRFTTEAPSLDRIMQLASVENLPDLEYHISGHVTGSPSQFRIDDLDVALGRSDVRGQLSLALEGRPRLAIDLESAEVDVADLARDRADRTRTAADETPPPVQAQIEDRVFSDEPFDLEVLDRLDAAVHWHVSSLRFLTTTVSGIDLTASLEKGRLTVGPFDAIGEHGGHLTGELLREPAADGHRIDLQLSLRGAKTDLTTSSRGSGAERTTTDVVMELSSHGRTPHEAASRANGDVIVSLSGGQVDSSIVDLIGADIVVSLLDALNPFSGAGAETVGLDCAVFVVDVTDGLVLAEPMAVKTDNVTVLGHGAVALDTEQLDFEWVTKPRKGLGVSASTITNPYVKLGGSLTKPALEVKPAQAVISTGVAVATAGLSLLGKGLYDRVTSEGKVCEKALAEAQRRLQGEAPHQRFLLFR